MAPHKRTFAGLRSSIYAILFGKNTMRAFEAGADGVEYLVSGAGDEVLDVEIVQDWRSDETQQV